MNPDNPTHDPRDLVEYPDDDAALLAVAAVESLPDVTALVVLADRFQELGDHKRENMARRIAAILATEGLDGETGGQRAIDRAFHNLTPEDGRAAAWLTLWRLPRLWMGVGFWIPDSVRYAGLAVLSMAGPNAAATAKGLDWYQPFARRLPQGRAPGAQAVRGIDSLARGAELLLTQNEFLRAVSRRVAELSVEALCRLTPEPSPNFHRCFVGAVLVLVAA